MGEGRERERERERASKNPKQALYCQHRARRGARTHEPRAHDLSHPGAPTTSSFKQLYCDMIHIPCNSMYVPLKKESCGDHYHNQFQNFFITPKKGTPQLPPPLLPSPSPWQPLTYFLSPQICLLWTLYPNRIIGHCGLLCALRYDVSKVHRLVAPVSATLPFFLSFFF